MAYQEEYRRQQRTTGTVRDFVTVGWAASRTDTGVPKVGDSLSGETLGIAPVCQDVQVQEGADAGRVRIVATWRGYVARTETFPLANAPA